MLDKMIKIVKKKMNIIEDLEHKNRSLTKVKEFHIEEIKKLKESNLFYQKSRRELNHKAELYKSVSIQLLDYISRRGSAKEKIELNHQFEDKDNKLKILGNKLK